MDYSIRKITTNRYQINIIIQIPEEISIIESFSKEHVKTYFYNAIVKKLGPHADYPSPMTSPTNFL